MSWLQVFETSLESNRVRELYLRQLPTLKNCKDWTQVKEVGRVYYKGKYANYNGAIVRLGEKYAFVDNSVLQAVGHFRPWKFNRELRVIDEQEWKKKVTDFHKKQKKR